MIEKGQVRVYCCGGGGINIGSQLEKYRELEVGFANLFPVYIDASKSNIARIAEDVSEDDIYLFEGLDGSGQVRGQNYKQISSSVQDILHKYKPLDLNIVLFSSAGGTGSTVGASLVSELLGRNELVISLIVGNTNTRKSCDNTLKTLMSLESIAGLRKTPVVSIYRENTKDITREQVDESIIFNVARIASLFSRQNYELDSQDLTNFLKYDSVTSFKPKLVSLSILDGDIKATDFDSFGNIITVATLSNSANDSHFPVVPEYQCTGIIPKNCSDKNKAAAPYNFVISDGIITNIASNLKNILDELTESQNARIAKHNPLDTVDPTTEDGLIL